jgi:hypothetical protein
MNVWKDPIVEEVRAIRKQIEEECDNDFDKLRAEAKKIEEEFKDRVVSRARPFRYRELPENATKVAEPRQPAATEPWLRGRIAGVHPSLMPIAHSMMQVMEDLPRIVEGLTRQQLYATPGGAASIAFHLKHLPGSLDRLYTYARGEKLTDEQFARIKTEKEPDDRPVDELVTEAINVLEKALQQLKETKPETLHDTRLVGRAGLPSNQLALLYHGAEHCQRHIGAMIATAKIIRASKQ